MKVRRALNTDLRAIVDVHVKAFPGFFLTLMGKSFLKELYSGFLREDEGFLLVADDGAGKILGFAAGAKNPEFFFQVLKKKRALFFVLAATPAIIRNPIPIFKKLWGALFYRGDNPNKIGAAALLSSIGVDPNYSGRSIGGSLLMETEELVRGSGCRYLYLTTDANGNEAVVGFYKKNGYEIESSFLQSKEREMLRFIKKL